MAGVQIGSHVNDWNLDAEELYPVFEEAERLGAAIFIHPWEMFGREHIPKYWMPWYTLFLLYHIFKINNWICRLVGMPAETTRSICSMIFGGVFERLPNLKVCFAHGGGSFPATIGRIEQGYLVRPDLCQTNCKINPRSFLGKFWVDSLVHDDNVLKFVVDLMGANRVIVGSDYPFPCMYYFYLISSIGFNLITWIWNSGRACTGKVGGRK